MDVIKVVGQILNNSQNLIKNNQLFYIIIICILFNVVGLFFPILRNDDPTLYASIAKNIILSKNWVYLTYPLGVDWLDKPHLPFWITAISFKIFGINSFAYILPGFLFNLIGAYYTYLLGKYLFNQTIGLIATIIYLSSFHLLLSSTTDVRAEVYLMGMIMPACYYFLHYFSNARIKLLPLFFASIVTACAIMTKGIFVLFTIGGGVFWVIVYNCYTKKINYIQAVLRLVLSIGLIAIFISPEIIALYLQFDKYPNKIIFGISHVSGIKWFLWDSQIGRFFNTGPITRADSSNYSHYFFFIHTYLWAFLPWSLVLIVALWDIIKHKLFDYRYLFLLVSFLITFVLFSLTSFQLDYYTNIIMPFAAIICAVWFYKMIEHNDVSRVKILNIQVYLSIILVIAFILASIYILTDIYKIIALTLGFVILMIIKIFSHRNYLNKAIVYSVLAINYVFIVLLLVYGGIYAKYDVGYNIANYINQQKNKLAVIDYKLHSLTLDFYSKDHYKIIGNIDELANVGRPYYVVTDIKNLNELKKTYQQQIIVIKYFYGTTIDKVIQNAINLDKFYKSLNTYVLLKIVEK